MESKHIDEREEFDKIDRKIFYAFSQDCRLNKKKLAGEMRISPERLHYRIEKLKGDYFEPGVVVNPLALDMPMYLLAANGLRIEEFEKISEQDCIYLATSLIGLPECVFVVITERIMEFLHQLGAVDVDVNRLTGIQVDDFNGWGVDMESTPTPETKSLALSKKHKRVLKETIRNPEESAYQLSKHMDHHYKTIKKYQKDLHENGVIKKWRYQCDLFKMGFTPYFVHISTKPSETEAVKEFQLKDNNTGFLYQSNNKLFFWYITRRTRLVHEFTSKLKEKFEPTYLEVSHVGDQYKIDMNTPILCQL